MKSASFQSVVLFADVSGFTKLTESLSQKESLGTEQLAKHLNTYLEMLVREILGTNGDIIKFAGDALLCVWPPKSEDLEHGNSLCTPRLFHICFVCFFSFVLGYYMYSTAQRTAHQICHKKKK